jgi:4,5-dihydroxyphthalate decarboxylase
VEALLDGRVKIEGAELDFIPVEPISRAFRRALRGDEFDVSEMALVTLAMAVGAGLPWVGLPIVVMRGFHHGALRVLNHSEIRGPKDLVGRKVGVRAYSQTTGVWLRGVLEQEHGIASDAMTWVTLEDAHVAGFTDPAFVVRAAEGAKLHDLLNSGEIDAAIGDGSTSFADSRSVIAGPEKAAADWYARTGIYPVNHLIAFRKDLLGRDAAIGEKVQKAFGEARELWLSAVSEPVKDDLPYGRVAHEAAIEAGLEFSFRQGLTKRRLRYDEVFWG